MVLNVLVKRLDTGGVFLGGKWIACLVLPEGQPGAVQSEDLTEMRIRLIRWHDNIYSFE
jgi:hypothetical protein